MAPPPDLPDVPDRPHQGGPGNGSPVGNSTADHSTRGPATGDRRLRGRDELLHDVRRRGTTLRRRRTAMLTGALGVTLALGIGAVAGFPGDEPGEVETTETVPFVDSPGDDAGSGQPGDDLTGTTIPADATGPAATGDVDDGTASTDDQIVIPAGLTVAEITALMAEHPNLDAATIDDLLERGEFSSALVPSDRFFLLDNFRQLVEGTLAPGTYAISSPSATDEVGVSDEAALLENMVTTMADRVTAIDDELGLPAEAVDLGLAAYDLIIIASIIEEEAIIDADRARIARVIYNRLDAGAPLGIDATIRYAVGKTAGEPLTQDDLETDSPYNTRHPDSIGLPPTPISAPSEASLRAAFAPADGPWLFYALTNEGGVEGAHAFATTIDEHAANIARCRDLGLCPVGANATVRPVSPPAPPNVAPQPVPPQPSDSEPPVDAQPLAISSSVGVVPRSEIPDSWTPTGLDVFDITLTDDGDGSSTITVFGNAIGCSTYGLDAVLVGTEVIVTGSLFVDPAVNCVDRIPAARGFSIDVPVSAVTRFVWGATTKDF